MIVIQNRAATSFSPTAATRPAGRFGKVTIVIIIIDVGREGGVDGGTQPESEKHWSSQ